MNRRQKSDRQRAESATASDSIEALLGNAPPRPVPPAADEAQIRAAVHAEWQEQTGRRVRRRKILSLGLAASLMVAVFAGLLLLRAPGGDPIGRTVATIDRQFGVIRISVLDSVRASSSGASILTGQTLETGDASGLALAWSRGGSLRLDAASRVKIESPNRIRLLAGRVYYDSVTDPLAINAPQAVSTKILIETPHGVLRHIGTQFVAEIADDALQVRVREGAVRLEHNGVRDTALAGQALTIAADRRVVVSSIDGAGSEWRWVADLAPVLNLDGRTAAEALRWLSRETGQQIGYETRGARDLAESAGLQGLGNLRPATALGLILSTAGLEARVEDGRIVIFSAVDGA
jgi:ferric-dicitrate binding protein FerR (iron transport regulator)